jgi:hypothetical protein
VLRGFSPASEVNDKSATAKLQTGITCWALPKPTVRLSF